MGFALFTQSGTFNPSSYGLSAGDVVYAVVVGGGGGGAATRSNSYTRILSAGGTLVSDAVIKGGAGGTSSFGSLLSASGGRGGATALLSATRPLGHYYVLENGSYGVGGWLPDAMPVNSQPLTVNFGAAGTSTLYRTVQVAYPWPFTTLPPTLQGGGNYCNIMMTPFLGGKVWSPRIQMTALTNGASFTITWKALSDIHGGNYCVKSNRVNTFSLYEWASLGYGAGGCSNVSNGNSSSSNYYDMYGASGEIRKSECILTGGNVVVSVGGGGGGGVHTYYSDGDQTFYNGVLVTNAQDGTAGAAGAGAVVREAAYGSTSSAQFTGIAGGYGSSPNDMPTTTPSYYQNAVMAGGGMSGCVAVWW